MDILNDRLAARIPLAPGDADNFVLGAPPPLLYAPMRTRS